MIKLIACDMDGTLLNEEGNLSEEFFDVFEELDKRNIKFVVASGRQYFQLLKSFEEISDRLVYIAENGTIVKYKDEELYVDALPREAVKDIVKFGSKIKDVQLVVCGKKCAYIDTNRAEVVDEINKYYFKYKIVDSFEEIDDDILKVAVLDVKGAENNSYNKFYQEFNNRLQVIVSGKIWLDIYNKGTSKGVAIKLIQDKFGKKK
jgi:Cof subfamily protein (haloacid dehalogenase superfamily)